VRNVFFLVVCCALASCSSPAKQNMLGRTTLVNRPIMSWDLEGNMACELQLDRLVGAEGTLVDHIKSFVPNEQKTMALVTTARSDWGVPTFVVDLSRGRMIGQLDVAWNWAEWEPHGDGVLLIRDAFRDGPRLDDDSIHVHYVDPTVLPLRPELVFEQATGGVAGVSWEKPGRATFALLVVENSHEADERYRLVAGPPRALREREVAAGNTKCRMEIRWWNAEPRIACV
jgi:hypothetical protein